MRQKFSCRKRKLSALCLRYSICDFHWLQSICHFRDDKGTGAEVRPAIVAGIVSFLNCTIISLVITQGRSKNISAIRDRYLNKE